MKKFFEMCLFIFCVSLITGCEKVKEQGVYKEGTYFGYDKFESYGDFYVTTAVVYVNEDGMIKSVYLDSTYSKDGVSTTKKTLGDDYGMKSTSSNMGNIPGGAEWYEQVAKIEEKVVSEQGLDWVKFSDSSNTKLDTDTISGVTINSDTYINAIGNALKNAK